MDVLVRFVAISSLIIVMTVEYVCLYFIRQHRKIYVRSIVCDKGLKLPPGITQVIKAFYTLFKDNI